MENEHNVLIVPKSTNYWFLRAGSNAKWLQDFVMNNYIAVDSENVQLDELISIGDSSETNNIAEYRHIFYEKLKLKNEELKVQKNESSLKGSSTIKAKQIYDFINNINPGDIVIVPKKHTNSFSICYVCDDEVKSGSNKFMRNVRWIKSVGIAEFPDKLYWIKNSHRTLMNIKNNSDDINQILSNIYIYDGKINVKLNVTTREPISANDWFNFQSLIKDISGNKNNEIMQKLRVSSPGSIILTLVTNPYSVGLALTLFASVFGMVKTSHFSVTGFLNKHGKKMDKLEEEKLKAEIDQINAENRIKNAQAESLEIKNKKALAESISEKAKNVRDSMGLSSDEVGTSYPDKKQKDN